MAVHLAYIAVSYAWKVLQKLLWKRSVGLPLLESGVSETTPKRPLNEVTAVVKDIAPLSEDDHEIFADRFELKNDVAKHTQRLLRAIYTRDFEEYCKLVSPDISTIGYATFGHVVVGPELHKMYFDSHEAELSDHSRLEITAKNPIVHLLGRSAECASISYVKSTEASTADGWSVIRARDETIVWRRADELSWIAIHIHC